MDHLLRDLRLGLRGLRRHPLFSAVAVLSLAVGIGSATAVMSVVDALLLRAVPGVSEPDRVVEVGRTRHGDGFDSFAWPDFVDLRERAAPLEHLAGWRSMPLSFMEGGRPERASGLLVSPAYFDVMGLSPARGRFFTGAEESGVGQHPVAVVSHRFWQRRLEGDPGAVGRVIDLNRHSFTVVGVAPAAFRGHVVGLHPDVYVPMVMYPAITGEPAPFEERGSMWFHVVGRLAEGATVEEADAATRAVFAALAEAYPETNEDRGARVVPLGLVPGAGRGPVAGFLAVLSVLVGLILLVTCANVAGMLLARSSTRTKEMAVRLSLGAPRARLVRQLVVEAMVLFVLGGAGGILLAFWATGFAAGAPLPVPVEIDLALRPDVSVLAVALAVTAVTGVAFALLPALQTTRPALLPALRGEGAGTGVGRDRLRGWFVTGQVGLSLVVLVAAGLFTRALQRVGGVQTGFDPAGVHMTSVDLSLEGYASPEEGQAFHDALLARLRAAPGVRSAALGRDIPLDMSRNSTGVVPDGWDPAGGPGLGVDYNVVSDGYFETLDVPLLQGRTLAATDRRGTQEVAVVSRRFAERAWPGEDPLGRRFRFGALQGPEKVVVGVVEDVKNSLITDDPEPMVYLPLAQAYSPEIQVLIESTTDPAATSAVLRREIHSVDPGISLTPVVSVKELTGLGILPQRLAAWLTSTLGLLALLLSGMGIYGVVAFGVVRRRREIGIRMALGAERRRVVGMVLRSGLAVAFPGVVVGALLAAGLVTLLRSFLLGVSPLDPLALGAVALLLVAVVVLATWVPARRAAAVDPMATLRRE